VRSLVRLLSGTPPGDNLGQVVHTHVPHSCLPSSIIWFWPKGVDALRLGKVTIGVALHWPCFTDLVICSPMGSAANIWDTSRAHSFPWEILPYSVGQFAKF